MAELFSYPHRVHSGIKSQYATCSVKLITL